MHLKTISPWFQKVEKEKNIYKQLPVFLGLFLQDCNIFLMTIASKLPKAWVQLGLPPPRRWGRERKKKADGEAHPTASFLFNKVYEWGYLWDESGSAEPGENTKDWPRYCDACTPRAALERREGLWAPRQLPGLCRGLEGNDVFYFSMLHTDASWEVNHVDSGLTTMTSESGLRVTSTNSRCSTYW